jgi:hypothetical protein
MKVCCLQENGMELGIILRKINSEGNHMLLLIQRI